MLDYESSVELDSPTPNFSYVNCENLLISFIDFRVPQDVVSTGGKCLVLKWVNGEYQLKVSAMFLINATLSWFLLHVICCRNWHGNSIEEIIPCCGEIFYWQIAKYI